MNIRSSANISMRETNRTYRYNNTGVLSLTIRRPEIRLPSSPKAQANINRRFARSRKVLPLHLPSYTAGSTF